MEFRLQLNTNNMQYNVTTHNEVVGALRVRFSGGSGASPASAVSKSGSYTGGKIGALPACSTSGSGLTAGSGSSVGVRQKTNLSTCTVCRLRVSGWLICTTIGEKNFSITHGPVHSCVSFFRCCLMRGFGQNNQTVCPTVSAWCLILRSK